MKRKYLSKLVCEEEQLIIGDYEENDPSVAISLLNRTRIIRMVLLLFNQSINEKIDVTSITVCEASSDLSYAVSKALEFCNHPPSQVTNNEIVDFFKNQKNKQKISLEEESFMNYK